MCAYVCTNKWLLLLSGLCSLLAVAVVKRINPPREKVPQPRSQYRSVLIDQPDPWMQPSTPWPYVEPYS